MTLDIDTFSNVSGGFSFFKALGHPLAAPRIRAVLDRLAGPVAIYDPHGHAAAFAALYDIAQLDCAGIYVQDLGAVGKSVLGHEAQPVTALPGGIGTVLVLAFDAQRMIDTVRHLVPEGAQIVSLDAGRLDDDMLTNPKRYLDPINFATNFAFFRDAGGCHTRLVTINYWGGYSSVVLNGFER